MGVARQIDLGMFMNLVKALIFMRMRDVLTGVLYLATIDLLQLIDFKRLYKSSDLWSTHASNPHEGQSCGMLRDWQREERFVLTLWPRREYLNVFE